MPDIAGNGAVARPRRQVQLPADLRTGFAVERQPYRRSMTGEEIMKLQGIAATAFDADVTLDFIESVVHYCCWVDRRIDGRAAGDIEDMVIRYLLRFFSSLAAPPDVHDAAHLEIGTLFGASAVFGCHAVQLAGRAFRNCVIDPFEGYYRHDKDPLTGTEVSEEVFRGNLAKFGFGAAQVEVFKGLSGDPGIVRDCARKRFLSLLIDGDHGYAGVKQDWINYSGLVVPGGYVLIDDYNNRNWPEITEFVNREILAFLVGAWTPVLVFGHSIVLRRNEVSAPDVQERVAYALGAAERTVAQQREQNRELRERIEALQASLSWRITAPLRAASGRLKRILGGSGSGGSDGAR